MVKLDVDANLILMHMSGYSLWKPQVVLLYASNILNLWQIPVGLHLSMCAGGELDVSSRMSLFSLQ